MFVKSNFSSEMDRNDLTINSSYGLNFLIGNNSQEGAKLGQKGKFGPKPISRDPQVV